MSFTYERLPNSVVIDPNTTTNVPFFIRYQFTNTFGFDVRIDSFADGADWSTILRVSSAGTVLTNNFLTEGLTSIVPGLSSWNIVSANPPNWVVPPATTAFIDVPVIGKLPGVISGAAWAPLITVVPNVAVTKGTAPDITVNSSNAVDLNRMAMGDNVIQQGAETWVRYEFTNNLGQFVYIGMTDNWNNDIFSTVTSGGQPNPAPGPAIMGTWNSTGNVDFSDPNAFEMENPFPFPPLWRLDAGQIASYDVGLLGINQGLDTGGGVVFSPIDNTGAPVASTTIFDTITVSGFICVHEDTLVKTPNGVKRISEFEAGELCYDARGQLQRVEKNLCSGTTKKYVRIQRNALGKEQPSANLLIARGHPLLLNGKEVPCEELIDGHMIDEVELEQPARLFTLCTEGRGFVEMQGLLVGTWSHASLENFTKNDGLGTMLRLTEQ